MWILLTLAALIALPIVGLVMIYVRKIRFSEGLVAQAIVAQSFPEQHLRTIVVAGDSTAVGVGAKSPWESVAGRIIQAFPDVRVVNVSVSGARIGDVIRQLESQKGVTADLVLIQAVANDVVAFRPVERIERELRTAIARARDISDNVILMPGHNFSFAPFFYKPMCALITRHAGKVHRMLMRVTAETGVTFVDLIRGPDEDPFYKEPQRLYCPDGLHPSGEGYAIWFAELLAKGRLADYLRATGAD